MYIYNVFGLRIKTISPLVSSALCIPQVWFLFSPLHWFPPFCCEKSYILIPQVAPAHLTRPGSY